MKIKKILPLLLILLAPTAGATDIMLFSAQIEDELLAEETILLTHCLSERNGLPWEFSGEVHGTYWLEVRQKGRELEARYHKGKQENVISFKDGESEAACERLEPKEKNNSPEISHDSFLPENRLSDKNTETEISGTGLKGWPWLGLGAAAVGAFLFWRSRQPDHGGIAMH